MSAAVSHRFVDLVPDRLEDGILYICIPYETAVHLCLCGCRNEVVTPFHPRQWSVTFDGYSVSLAPSIGNWSFACRSHYWIKNNLVVWDKVLTQVQIGELRAIDQRKLNDHYGTEGRWDPVKPSRLPWVATTWRRLTKWLSK